jgi:methyltransferase-like protein
MIANHSIKHVPRVTDISFITVRPNSKRINNIEESLVVNVFGPEIKITSAYTTILILLHEYFCPLTFQ